MTRAAPSDKTTLNYKRTYVNVSVGLSSMRLTPKSRPRELQSKRTSPESGSSRLHPEQRCGGSDVIILPRPLFAHLRLLGASPA